MKPKQGRHGGRRFERVRHPDSGTDHFPLKPIESLTCKILRASDLTHAAKFDFFIALEASADVGQEAIHCGVFRAAKALEAGWASLG